MHKGRNRAVDMTSGNIWKLLVMVSIPLLLGNMFQQLYNTVDSVILGRFVGKEALAAVGSTTSLCNTLIRFFNGISIGAGVIISRDFGAKDNEGLHRAVETTIALAFAMGALVSLLSIPLVPLMLDMMKTAGDLLPEATTYMRIYVSGILFLFTYNMGSCILRAVGDSKTPLYFLIFSSLVNIVLDFIFIVGFRMGVAGAAIATVAAEGASAVLVCMVLTRTIGPHRLVWKELRIDVDTVKSIFLLGLPVGIQQSLTAFSNAFVQSYINAFDDINIIAGWSCHTKVDQFSMLPVQSIGQTTTTFVSQNLGAGNLERAKKGTWAAVVLGVGTLAAISAGMSLFAPELVSMFNQDPAVIECGVQFILLMVPFRFLSAWNQTCAGALRGAGDAKGPMIIMLISFVACRQMYLMIVTQFINDYRVVGFGYPFGWICCAIIQGVYYRRSNWEEKWRQKSAIQA